MFSYSPLRYPGGKSRLTDFMSSVIHNALPYVDTYIEPFAGGAGVAIGLLQKKIVKNVIINDYDVGIFSFWKALTEESEWFLSELRKCPINLREWHRQKEIFESEKKYSKELGFAVFYLNRTNRSGILTAGPVGGLNQTGKWKLDARFNKEKLISKIQLIVSLKKHITIYNDDIIDLIAKIHVQKKLMDRSFIYFDPPYFNKGQELYKNFFKQENHKKIADSIIKNITAPWIVTYDNVQNIKDIYNSKTQGVFELNYSVAQKRKATELMIFSERFLYDKSLENLKKDHQLAVRLINDN